MWAFLQTYGIWILVGLYFLWMLRMHASGRGCGMGHSQQDQSHTSQYAGQDEEYAERHRTIAVRDNTWNVEGTSAEPIATNRRLRGCH